MSISKLLLFVLFSIISSKNVVFIGDSRVCGFAYDILGFDYTYHNAVYGSGSYIISEYAVKYGGHSNKVIAEVGASYYTFTTKSKAVYSGVHSILSSSAAGTVVLMWLGVNNPDSASTFNYYKSLAQQYKGLTFYAVSVSGVSSKCDEISNDTIRKFNNNLRTKVNGAGLKNLKYKSILNNDDPCQIYNSSSGKVTFKVLDSTTDYYGVHYTGNGDREVLLAMLAGI